MVALTTHECYNKYQRGKEILSTNVYIALYETGMFSGDRYVIFAHPVLRHSRHTHLEI